MRWILSNEIEIEIKFERIVLIPIYWVDIEFDMKWNEIEPEWNSLEMIKHMYIFLKLNFDDAFDDEFWWWV